MNVNRLDGMVIDSVIHHGEPCITDTRVPVSGIVGSFADCDTPEEILAAYPQLSADDIRAVLKFRSRCSQQHRVHFAPPRWRNLRCSFQPERLRGIAAPTKFCENPQWGNRK